MDLVANASITVFSPNQYALNETLMLKARVEEFAAQVDAFFTSIMGIIVIILHLGFGYLEAGSVRSKNATSVMMKNMLDLFLGAFGYWIVGYTLAYGRGSSFLGMYPYIAGQRLTQEFQYSNWFIQFSYAATASSIISGVIVERCSFVAYLIYSFLTTAVTYPIVSHWAWTSEGWLNVLGFKDFAGSGVVHMCGGACAIMACVIIGPRYGKYPRKGEPALDSSEFESHNIPVLGLGAMILFVGFLAFNGGAVLHISKTGDGELVAKIIINTILSGAGGAMGGLIAARVGLIGGKRWWSYLHAVNGGLFGMVSVCANCDTVDIWAAWLIALCGGPIYSVIIKILEKLEIDDPLNAIAVHFGGGLWGLLASSVLRDDALSDKIKAGQFLAYNCIGALAITAWSMAMTAVIFMFLKYTGILRPSEDEEILGMDLATHEEPAYRFKSLDFSTSSEGDGCSPPGSISGQEGPSTRHKSSQANLTDPFLTSTRQV
ncbi:putative ammonium transporter 1 [Neocloeon triangulifer]|uniref:putative ammonium transporter 1 n=1 Tax=Neocloeon triangulifer TaxID=2078957 RepID=UPI00286EBA8A|nr:putative ammonium transporter 1 [Neocloeon triangulifer]